MRKKISRRFFLEGTTVSLLASLVFGKGAEDDYVILDYLSPKVVNSLEECLVVPKKTYQNKDLTLTINRTPEILYYIDSKESGTKVRTGLIYMLNKMGFFLTANHIFDEFTNESGKKYEPFENPIVIAHSPSHCFTYPARFLIKSKKDDLLLGKIDIPSPLDMDPVRIADERVSYPVPIYSLSYKDMGYFNNDVLEKIISSGEFINDYDKKTLSFHNKKCIKYDDRFQPTVTLGTGYHQPDSEINPRCWDLFYTKGKSGDSGAPIFDFHNQFMGLITDGYGEAMCYTGPLKVRKMIEHYITKAKKK